MLFRETEVAGAFEIIPELKCDERGFFARSWCRKEFEAHGLNPRLEQCSISFNLRKGTLRGMHWQAEPFQETKSVRCTQGAIYDVALDLRKNSPTYKKWTAVILSAAKRNMLYIPDGCGHGFITLEDETEISYQISEFYTPESTRGVRWDDPVFGIVWPLPVEVISERDRTYPDFES
jgi:dTDP-4-dehydrorhamnose 3,5-epimerase